MDKKELYAKICYELEKKEAKLQKAMATFVLNPEISTLIDEVQDLKNEMSELEKEVED